jgi:hypothetical protein
LINSYPERRRDRPDEASATVLEIRDWRLEIGHNPISNIQPPTSKSGANSGRDVLEDERTRMSFASSFSRRGFYFTAPPLDKDFFRGGFCFEIGDWRLDSAL